VPALGCNVALLVLGGLLSLWPPGERRAASGVRVAGMKADDPDRVVAPEEMKKPPHDDPKAVTAPTAPSNPSIVAEASATPSPETAQETRRSVARSGTGESLRRVRATWQKELAVHLDKYKRYPSGRPPQSAGESAFDDAALDMMRRADPVPPPPPLVADEGLSFSMPVSFRVKHGIELIKPPFRWPSSCKSDRAVAPRLLAGAKRKSRSEACQGWSSD
jgi:TonB family protein